MLPTKTKQIAISDIIPPGLHMLDLYREQWFVMVLYFYQWFYANIFANVMLVKKNLM